MGEAESKQPWHKAYHRVGYQCSNPKARQFRYYGGRGIKRLMKREDFKTIWFRDKAFNMKNPCLDRKDTAGNFTLENCRYIEAVRRGGKKQRDKIYYERNKNNPALKLIRKRGKEKWKLKNQDILKVYRTVHYAIKNGILIRPKKCTECGAMVTPHAHHDDYKKPLKVKWLCHACHEIIHHK